MLTPTLLREFVDTALREDVGPGDYTTLACIPPDATGQSVLWVKEAGVLAGLEVAEAVFRFIEPEVRFERLMQDGDLMQAGDQAFTVAGKVHTLLTGERLALNCLQRMSGIATLTRQYVSALEGYTTRLLDTRKTTPNFRVLEKEAVRIGGGVNHRMGLYDMILLKDNHIDFCGGITQAIQQTRKYLRDHHLTLPVEIEVRGLSDIEEVLQTGGVDRILLDNFSPRQTKQAVELIAGRYVTESSGGITLEQVREFAEAGVDYISAGSVIHHAVSLDLSLKAVRR
jgi:nicotinate-nucleotide pyrophosphorylase (carboxylating)